MPSVDASVRVTPAAWGDPDVQRLALAQQAELRARYDGGPNRVRRRRGADIGVVLLARDGAGMALGCGALRKLGDGVAELKRMYVVPAARGRRISGTLLGALEQEALRRGWTTLRLETGPRQPEAVGLYSGAGYRPIGPFGAYLLDPDASDSLFFERVLA